MVAISEVDLASGEFPDQGARLIESVKAGNIYICRGALQRVRKLDALRTATLDALAKVVQPVAARQIADQGFEQIHRLLTPDEIVAGNEAVVDAVRPIV